MKTSMVPKWTRQLPMDKIIIAARNHVIPIPLFSAIIMTESSGKTQSSRFEPEWKYFEKPEYFAKLLGISEDEERKMQATGIGLCQIQGSCIRELGYQGDLHNCFDADLNLDFGARKLKQILDKWPYWLDAASGYNHGHPWYTDRPGYYGNDQYVGRVRGYLKSFVIDDPQVLCSTVHPHSSITII